MKTEDPRPLTITRLAYLLFSAIHSLSQALSQDSPSPSESSIPRPVFVHLIRALVILFKDPVLKQSTFTIALELSYKDRVSQSCPLD